MISEKIKNIIKRMIIRIFAYLNSYKLMLNATINEPNKKINPTYNINNAINKLNPLNRLNKYTGSGFLFDKIKLLAVRPKNK